MTDRRDNRDGPVFDMDKIAEQGECPLPGSMVHDDDDAKATPRPPGITTRRALDICQWAIYAASSGRHEASVWLRAIQDAVNAALKGDEA